ncbi:MAG: hypothetical protein ACLFRL_03875 [Desulfohalobiaceae bacterium]
MKRKLFLAALVVGLILAGGMALAQEQGYTRAPAGAGQGSVCPWNGQGPGKLQQGQGSNWHGPGKFQGRPGKGPGQHMRGSRFNQGQLGPYAAQQQTGNLEQEQAKQLADNYLAGNPNLKIEDISEQDNSYVATVVTQDGSLVERLLIDKNTGRMSKSY